MLSTLIHSDHAFVSARFDAAAIYDPGFRQYAAAYSSAVDALYSDNGWVRPPMPFEFKNKAHFQSYAKYLAWLATSVEKHLVPGLPLEPAMSAMLAGCRYMRGRIEKAP